MNRSVLTREIRSGVTYTVIWTAGLLLSLLANTLGNTLPQRSSGEPYDILAALASGLANMTSLGAVFAMILGSLVISKEEDEKTIEFLLSHPLTRGEIALSKIVAFSIGVLFLNLVVFVACLLILVLLGPGGGKSIATFASMYLSVFLLMYAFGAAGVFLSMFIVKGGGAVGYSIGVPLFLTFLALLEGSENQTLRTLSYLSPFRYVNVAKIMTAGSVDVPFVVVAAVVSAGLLLASVATYRKKEFAV